MELKTIQIGKNKYELFEISAMYFTMHAKLGEGEPLPDIQGTVKHLDEYAEYTYPAFIIATQRFGLKLIKEPLRQKSSTTDAEIISLAKDVIADLCNRLENRVR